MSNQGVVLGQGDEVYRMHGVRLAVICAGSVVGSTPAISIHDRTSSQTVWATVDGGMRH